MPQEDLSSITPELSDNNNEMFGSVPEMI